MGAKKKAGGKRRPKEAEGFCRFAVIRKSDGITCFYRWRPASAERKLIAQADGYNAENPSSPFLACVEYREPFPVVAEPEKPLQPGYIRFPAAWGGRDISERDYYKRESEQQTFVIKEREAERAEQPHELRKHLQTIAPLERKPLEPDLIDEIKAHQKRWLKSRSIHGWIAEAERAFKKRGATRFKLKNFLPNRK